MMNKEKALNILNKALEDLWEWYDGDMDSEKAREYKAMKQFIYKNLADEKAEDIIPVTLEEHLQDVFDKYTNWDGDLIPSVDDITLEEALTKAFESHPDEVCSFSLDQHTVFENASYITGYISICWIDKYGCLNHETAQWEVM